MPKTLILKPAKTSLPQSGKTLRILTQRQSVGIPVPPVPPVVHPLVGKMVCFEGADGIRVFGQVSKQVAGDLVAVRLAMPDSNGVLLLTDSEIAHGVSGLDQVEAMFREKKVRVFEDAVPFELDQKMVTIRDKDQHIVDYRDVTISGLASTFKEVTPQDRDGDYVMPAAFDKTLVEFRKNPVMLVDHRNSTETLVGSYSKIGTNAAGLGVEGRLSNAPQVQRIRFLVAEGHLKAFSIGGLFLYAPDARGIEEVRLYEVSLVPIPANPDALFQTRSVDLSDVVKSWNSHQKNLRSWSR